MREAPIVHEERTDQLCAQSGRPTGPSADHAFDYVVDGTTYTTHLCMSVHDNPTVTVVSYDPAHPENATVNSLAVNRFTLSGAALIFGIITFISGGLLWTLYFGKSK